MSDQHLRVLHVASESVPFIKTGGLADVVGALPTGLVGRGHDVRVAVPGYRNALHIAGLMGMEWLPQSITVESGGHDYYVGIGVIEHRGVTYYFLACNELFDRDGIYGPSMARAYEDNTRRFTVFCKAALSLPRTIGWVPQVIHAHDWQAGLLPALHERGWLHDLPATRTVFTIHNLAYQGMVGQGDLALVGLDPSLYNPMQLEHYGRLSLLKAGIVFADRVTTVSPTYAAEIQTAEGGYQFDGVMRHHNYKLRGILNGIDAIAWDPATDMHLAHHYSAADLKGKVESKLALQRELGLPEDRHVCLAGIVSRLVWQKGIDLVLQTVEPYILSGRLMLVVLGAGESALEMGLRHLQSRHPQRVCFWHGYNEGLAHRIEAGSDMFLMPSRFEPCGLNQMYSKRYGTLPVVRYTGGLADTVSDVIGDELGTGFTFGPIDGGHFSSVLDRAIGLYHHYPERWRQAVLAAMACDHSWDHVAGEYEGFYRSLVYA